MSSEQQAQIELKKFDMSSIKQDSIIMIIGRSASGKSVLVKDLMFYHQDIPFGTVISSTELTNGYYGNFIPQQFIYDEYDDSIMEDAFNRQTQMINKLNEGQNVDARTFVILDGCLHDCWKNNVITRVFMNGRHFNMMRIFTIQHPMAIGPSLRTNIDYTFIFAESNMETRRKVWKYYTLVFPTFEMFNEMLDACTADYGCLVIDNTQYSTNITDLVFWYKADEHPSFKMNNVSE